jgi:hypothetical protein
MKKIIIVLFLMTMFMVFCGGSCDRAETTQENYDTNTLGKEARLTEANQSKLLQRQPPPKIDFSNERENLSKRVKEWNNPNKIGYIYCLSDTGVPIAFYAIKGKVSSVNSMLTTNLQIVKDPNTRYETEGSLLMESPNFDGSYGTNGDAIFFYLTDGTYMEWNGKYMLASQPVKLSQQPLMTYQVKDK